MTFKDSVREAWREGTKGQDDDSATTTALELAAEADANEWRYLVLRFAGNTIGHQPPGDPKLINALASLGWRLVGTTKHGLYFERELEPR